MLGSGRRKRGLPVVVGAVLLLAGAGIVLGVVLTRGTDSHCSPGNPRIGHADYVDSVAFAPQGCILATASEDTVQLWSVANADDPRPLGAPLTGHTDEVRSVSFSPDGRTLATGSADTRVRLWDVSTPTTPRPLGGPLTRLGVSVRLVSPGTRD